MGKGDLIKILDDIEKYLNNNNINGALSYIENKKMEINSKADKASEYIDKLVNNLK